MNIPPVIVVAIYMALAWGMKQVFSSDFAYWGVAKPIAIALLFTGVSVALAGVLAFKRLQTTVDPMTPEKASNLVTIGIYKITRNPMYVGMLLGLLAWCVGLQSLSSLIAIPLFIAHINRFQIRREEQALVSLFGKSFEDYCDRVPRWLVLK